MEIRNWIMVASLMLGLAAWTSGCIITTDECDPETEVCADDNSETGSEGMGECLADQEGSCDCGDGEWGGTTYCGDDGTWGECVCGEIEYCIEGEVQDDCECADGAGTGTALCDADGLWGECACEAVCTGEAIPWCNPECYDSEINMPTDPDCNTNIPENSDSSDKDTSPYECDCDYWGFVCEAAAHCSNLPCACDPDCNYPDASIAACNSDGHCDSWCVSDYDPDCMGHEKNGKYCDENGGGGEDLSCDQNFNNCDAEFGSTTDCGVDPDCDGFDLACEGDAWCDGKCPDGSDPDCE